MQSYLSFAAAVDGGCRASPRRGPGPMAGKGIPMMVNGQLAPFADVHSPTK